MSALIVRFHSSEAFLLNDERAAQQAEVRGEEYVEGTYAALRTGPNGDEIAHFVDGAWQLPDGRRFSDWATQVMA